MRQKTVMHGLYVLRAAFNWALDAEIIGRNPCDRVQVPPDSKDEKVVHETICFLWRVDGDGFAFDSDTLHAGVGGFLNEFLRTAHENAGRIVRSSCAR